MNERVVDAAAAAAAVNFCAMTDVLCSMYATRVHVQPENCLTSYDTVHGYCVIYSSADRDSFILAERIIQSLWTSENIAQKAVILVGNKADLARSRMVTTEGKCSCVTQLLLLGMDCRVCTNC